MNMEILGIDHIGIVTKDSAAAADFYREMCGFETASVEEVPAMAMKITCLRKGQDVLELLEPDNKETGSFGVKHVAFLCRDIEAVLRLARGKGCRLLHQSPQSHGNLSFFFCLAPDGEMVEFVERFKEV
jgi:catechol 2,3-dioxygenase-like lactoylglutathione lyase family enzyme